MYMQTEIPQAPTRAKAQISQAFLEYKLEYTRPCFEAWIPQNRFMSAVYDALTPWGIQLRNVTLAPGNNMEEANLTFGLPHIGVIVQVALGFFKQTVVNPDWSRANQMIELFEKVKNTVLKSAGAEVKSQHTVLALHVKPEGLQQKECVSRAVEFKTKLGEDVVALGGGIYRRDSSLVFDKSAVFDDAVFVRLERQYPPETKFNSISESILKDEIQALNILGLDVEGL